MRTRNWTSSRKTQREYERAVKRAAAAAVKAVQGMRSINQIVAAMISVSEQDWFKQYAFAEARKMVKSVLVQNARTWREAARKGQRGLEIHQSLKAEFNDNSAFLNIIQENAKLIQTIPASMANDITRKAANEAIAGKRTDDIVDQILKDAPRLARWKADRIARTEVSKANATITQVRAEQIGINWYRWIGVEDERERLSHKKMEGVLVRFSDPPSPELLIGTKSSLGHYNAGCAPNCRCFASPVVDVDFLTWPQKVYRGGQIVRMSKRQFLAIQ